MSKKYHFPEYLLEASAQERVDYFESKKIEHKILKEVRKKALSAIMSSVDGPIIMVYGPTGIGKTTLCEHLIDVLKVKQRSPGDIPVAYMEAIKQGQKAFDWRDFFCNGLEALDEILINRKLAPESVIERREQAKSKLLNRQPTTIDLRRAFDSALINRSPYALFIDEGHHISKAQKSSTALDNMETLKSILNGKRTKFFLSGTYALLHMTDLSAQLNRRSCEIHFRRYKYDDSEDMEEFQKILVTFERALPLPIKPSFSNNIDYVYERTCGCVGILKDWFTAALELSIEENDKTLALDHLKEKQLSNKKLNTIAREIAEGELLFQDDSVDKLHLLLGMTKLENESDKPAKKGNQKPGARNPTRDPVGTEAVNQ